MIRGLLTAVMALVSTIAAADGVPTPTVVGPLPDSARQGTLVWNVAKLGYVAEEYLVSGTADVYDAVAMADAVNMLTRDMPRDMARRDDYSRPVLSAAQPYVTRIIVYRPKAPERFSGNVVVETAHPLQGGLAIVWSLLSGYFAQHGDIYVGIAHPVTFDSLRHSNPARYGQLSAVDPTQLWGMIAQVGALIKGAGSTSPLRRYRVSHLFLTGYSYTGVAATTFANFHHDSAVLADGRHVFDGYLPMANSMYVRPIDVPVIRVMTQSDFNSFGGLNNRREDSDAPHSRFRLWEVAGASHLNASPVIAPGAEPWVAATPLVEPPNLPQFSASDCSKTFPSGSGPDTLPLTYVMVSAFEHLYAWVRGGQPPPRAARIQTNADGSPAIDASGNAVGGLRLPELVVPAASYGAGSGACFLFGYRLPYGPDRMRSLYGSRDRYLARLREATRAQVQHGWLRPQEAQSIERAARLSQAF
jgi:hypothetical protein